MSTPNHLPRPPGELDALEQAWRQPRGWRALTTVNNTRIGRLYLATAFAFFLFAGALALAMRWQLAVPASDFMQPGTYNQFFTMHGTVMMFLFAIPMVEAIAVFLLPGMLGARDLPFPRLSAYAYWAYAFGGAGFIVTLAFGLSPDGGWFMYPPLTGKQYSPGLGADFWLLGIGFIEISAIAGAIELIIGILFTRAPGMTLARMPVYAWSMLVVALMVVFAFPPLIAGTALLELERAYDWPFFIVERGGDPLLWQHLFWFFGHPEVYIIFLPAAGMVSAMLPALVQTPLVARRAVIVSLVAVGALSFALWMHHMFTAGLGQLETMLVSAASMAIAIPTALQVFAWIATMWRGRVQLNAPTLFIFGFLLVFVLGGLTGVMVAAVPFDLQAHDTYFIVAHLHYVLVGGLVFPMLAAAYFWMPLFNGHRMSERVACWVFGLVFTGTNVAFFPMHASGLLGMPRRVYTYSAAMGWDGLNLASTVGAMLLAAGVLLFTLDMVRTLCRPQREHGNPWRSSGLEWLPQGEYGTRSQPEVRSAEPLWRQAGLAGAVEAGLHWLPGTFTGRRETLVTSRRAARPAHLLVLPGDSWLPFLCALGTAGFFLLLTMQLPLPAWLCGALALATLVAWLWGLDRPLPPGSPREAMAGDGVPLPIGASGSASHSWWATLVLVVVDGAIFASLAFALLHIGMALEVCPPPGARLPPAQAAWLAAALLAASSALAWWGGRRPRQGWPLLAAGACLLAAFALDLGSHLAAGLAPQRNAWSAAVAALLAYGGLHAAVLGAAALYVAARGGLRAARRATLDNTILLWHCGVAQALAGLALIRWL
ncbi:cytochrome ubiquinol oxidase subunit I [Pseudoduganella sp. DS3]|uniref:Cytochrome ubiquinol oxidase subunit I n=1 Tax=Pseudoduganella guangdongensis TaxID=2692179 RepID=A0A6N9HKY9_9BURK|nr:cbb3-type cytochrome c oxidase subunit I [Pseudoduganella guangdongensis]MYN03853.1 cytochrome ubiquinol oxidase subunit I [Pseudoduganella guangdongensis]